VGCDECGGTGYKGRMAIHEAFYFTKEIRHLIVKSGEEVDEELLKAQAKKDGTLNLRESGLEKVKLGMTSLEEVISSTTED
jgi:type IV pilus assembly protein PilB